MVKFGDVVTNANLVERSPEKNGITRIVGLEHIDPENLHIHRWNNISEGTSFTRKFVPGQTLFGKRRAYQRKVAYAEFTGICSGDILTFEPKDRNILLPELLPFICQSDAFFSHALDTSAGSLSPRTSWAALKNFCFPLPPIEEQKRLAELLWAADDTVLAYKKSLALFTKYFNNYIDLLLSSPILQQVNLENVLSKGIESGYSAPPNPDTADHWVLSLAALSEHGYIRGSIKPVAKTEKMIKASLKKGDLLISRSNTIEFVGFAGIFDEDRTDISFPDTMMRISVDTKRIIPEYLELVLLSRKGRTYMQKIASGTSNSMKKINKKTLAQFKFPLPSLDIQQKIVYNRYQKKFIEEHTINHINKLKDIILLLSGTTIGNSHV